MQYGEGTQFKALKVFRHCPSVWAEFLILLNAVVSHLHEIRLNVIRKIPQSLHISLNVTYVDSSSRAEDGIHCRGILNAISNHKVP